MSEKSQTELLDVSRNECFQLLTWITLSLKVLAGLHGAALPNHSK